jgi:hypothetical protein
MTVAELIEALRALPPNAEVAVEPDVQEHCFRTPRLRVASGDDIWEEAKPDDHRHPVVCICFGPKVVA